MKRLYEKKNYICKSITKHLVFQVYIKTGLYINTWNTLTTVNILGSSKSDNFDNVTIMHKAYIEVLVEAIPSQQLLSTEDVPS